MPNQRNQMDLIVKVPYFPRTLQDHGHFHVIILRGSRPSVQHQMEGILGASGDIQLCLEEA